MLLTQEQQDAFTELINIAFSRAAASLSEIVGQRVKLELPEVSIHSINSLTTEFTDLNSQQVASISQVFKGSMSGSAVLMLDQDSALALTNLVTGHQGTPITKLDASANEILTEVGNILLNACLGIFGNLLQIPVIFSVPVLSIESLNKVIDSLVSKKNELRYALLIRTALTLEDNSVCAYIAIVSSVSSLYFLIRAIETWAGLAVHS